MIFSSLVFVLVFLPFVLILYRICPIRQRLPFFILISLIYYVWGEYRIEILAYYVLVNFVLGLQIQTAARNKNIFLLLGVFLNIIPLVFYKYINVNEVNTRYLIPLGISFFVFQGISYLVDVSIGRYPAQKNLIKYTFFKTFFPPLIAGPILRYSEISQFIESAAPAASDPEKGLRRFIRGLAKKVIFANTMSQFTGLGIGHIAEVSFSISWLILVCYSIQIYFDFSGYSDMAIGLAEYFGISMPENFDRPFLSTSLAEFWTKWHMSLSRWFKDYVYLPLGGNKTKFNLVLVFLLSGIWHGSTFNFALWGLFHASFVVFEKIFFRQKQTKYPLINRIYVCFVVTISWILFCSPSFEHAKLWFKKCLGFDNSVVFVTENTVALHHFFSGYYLALFLLALVIVFRPVNLEKVKPGINLVLHVGLLLVCVVYLMLDSHQPFIYFHF